MAIFDVSKSLFGVNLHDFLAIFGYPSVPAAVASSTFSNASSTGYNLNLGVPGQLHSGTVRYSGTGFTYNTPGSFATGGTVTNLSVTEIDQAANGGLVTNNIINISGLSLSVQAVYQSYPNGDVLMAGDDTIIGSAFNDVLWGGAGNNRIDGGAGTDTVTYFYLATTSGAIIDLAAGTAKMTDVISAGKTAGHIDTLVSIENVIGTNSNDTIYGSAGANTLWGGAGNDTLDGRAGDDILNGGRGDDSLIGGLGNDTADYSTTPGDFPMTGGVTVDLVAGQSWEKVAGTFGHDTLSSIENVNGSDGDDWISGNNGANTLVGNAGNDTIYGLGGDDILIGGAGNDALYGGSGNDRIESGAGVDWVEGGDGNDVIIDDSGNAVPHEWSALYGGTGNDTIEGRGLGDNGMWGGTGADTLIFGAGSSYAYGGAGADTFGFGTDQWIGTAGSTNFAQIYDFELGIDHIKSSGVATVLNWGANTGIDFVTAGGVHETIMMMGITSGQLQATNWLQQ